MGNHRQFYLDRVATAQGRVLKFDDLDPLANNFVWLYQSFERKPKGSTSKIKSYDNESLNAVSKYAEKLPKDKGNIVKVSLGSSHSDNYDASSAMQMANIKNWLLNQAKSELLKNVDDDIVDELIKNSPQF